jgi:predicted esterase
MHGLRSLALLVVALSLGCRERTFSRPTSFRVAPARSVPSAPESAPSVRNVFVDTQEVPQDQPVFALRGGRPDGAVGVVLHGWCSHGMGFLQAFQWSAAEGGRFIALQGDHRCGSGPLRGWSPDVVALDRRIDAALRVYLEREPPTELVLIGSSQGVELAVGLARRFPQKYRRLVLASGPSPIGAGGLQQLSGAFLLSGQYEGSAAMRKSRDALRRAGIPAELRVVSGAGHADFHGQGDPLLREAFVFLNLPPG